MPIHADDLPPELRKTLKIPAQRRSSFGMHDVRKHAIRVLSQIADLSQDQRRRVLDHAQKLNRI